jgi:hypothetical protein
LFVIGIYFLFVYYPRFFSLVGSQKNSLEMKDFLVGSQKKSLEMKDFLVGSQNSNSHI